MDSADRSGEPAPGHPIRKVRALAVLIVAYRSVDRLEACIRSVETHLPGHDVHVWDNSGPGFTDVRRLASRVTGPNWYLGSENIGFAAAVNRLAAMVPDQDFLLLNPDAILTTPLTLTRAALNEPLNAAAAPMTSCSGAGGRPALLSRDQLPWDVAHRRLTPLNALGGPIGVSQRLRGTALSDLYRKQPTDVQGYLTGACLAISRQAWDSLGCFDEEFYLYGEEADWQRRAIESGWRVRLANEVAVVHSANGTVAGDPVARSRSDDLLRASVALQLEYRYGRRSAECYLAIVSLSEGIKRFLRSRSRTATAPGVLLTVDGGCDSAMVAERISIASALARNGFAVTVMSLQPLGALPIALPASIRLLRRPWWWPSSLPEKTPTILIPGMTQREKAFARLFNLQRRRTLLTTRASVDDLLRTSPVGST
ncbi:MAG: hypothetical protein WBB07_08405 [Mycobacterium sp.]